MRPRATSIVLAGVLLASLTGCTFTAEQATQQPYDPSDGFSAEIGDVVIRNALLISEDGENGNLVASIINSGSDNVSVKISWEDASGDRVDQSVRVEAGEARTLGTDSDPAVLNDIEAPPGSLFPIYFQYADYQGSEISVPVLTDELPEYSDLLPEEVAE